MARKTSDEERTRLNLSYPGSGMRRWLEEVKRLGPHPTDTAAINRSVEIYRELLIEQSKDSQIIIRMKDGTEHILKFI